MTTNLPASVRARLLNQARERGIPFQEMLVRYGIERLLYRLQQSDHAEDFILKGAMLFLDWTDSLHRPTKDADFMTTGSSDVERLEDVFRDVVTTSTEADGLEFNPDTIRGSEIREDGLYHGVRIKFDADLAGARIPLQVDVGFGDAIVPAPTSVSIPGLLDFPAPVLSGYTRYTTVAEKFEAMLKLGEVNSRMKDFHDIWTLCRRFEFEGAQLKDSIRATCERRATMIPADLPVALTPTFAEVPGKTAQWNVRQEASTDGITPISRRRHFRHRVVSMAADSSHRCRDRIRRAVAAGRTLAVGSHEACLPSCTLVALRVFRSAHPPADSRSPRAVSGPASARSESSRVGRVLLRCTPNGVARDPESIGEWDPALFVGTAVLPAFDLYQRRRAFVGVLVSGGDAPERDFHGATRDEFRRARHPPGVEALSSVALATPFASWVRRSLHVHRAAEDRRDDRVPDFEARSPPPRHNCCSEISKSPGLMNSNPARLFKTLTPVAPR